MAAPRHQPPKNNTSRRRPEGGYGQNHDSINPDWHHCHFGINFRKYHKDDEHELKGIRKINLKWFKDDPCYVRELYCYDLFRRYGIWTSAFSTYARVWLQIDAETPAYLGVFDMIETSIQIGTQILQNRVVLQPMEGCDCNEDGSPHQLTIEKYLKAARSGAGLVWFEANAVCPEGRTNPRQMMLTEENLPSFQKLLKEMREIAEKECGIAPVFILQLTHSGSHK